MKQEEKSKRSKEDERCDSAFLSSTMTEENV